MSKHNADWQAAASITRAAAAARSTTNRRRVSDHTPDQLDVDMTDYTRTEIIDGEAEAAQSL